jgi:hypothetical protein
MTTKNDNKVYSAYVYLVYRNSDTAEGRGPMVLDSVWKTRKLAEDYMDTKPGVMGRFARWSRGKFGDWLVDEQPVRDEPHDPIAEIKKRALGKLSAEEISALGLEIG